MFEMQDRLININKVLDFWLVGKVLSELNAYSYGSTIALWLSPSESIESSFFRLYIRENWHIEDRLSPKIFKELSKRLPEELKVLPYTSACIPHALDILRLYVLLGSIIVRAEVNAKSQLVITLEGGIEIHIDGAPSQPDLGPTDERAWSLEIETEGRSWPSDRPPYRESIWADEGVLEIDSDPLVKLKAFEELKAQLVMEQEERRKGGPFPKHHTN
ncbi:MAG: hypothetical protein JSS86_19780 [Cyanobacteria bacterium SZAS LIN-2]|nr:hypothetical protein [Cyanobacteria bacterium SZAS LIN-2]